MEKLTDWNELWAALSDIQSRAFDRKKTKGGTDDVWEERAEKFDKMVDERWRKPDSSRNFLVQKLKETPDASLLDIGAGTGKWSVFVCPFAAKITALEPSPAMQRVFRKKIETQGITHIDIVSGTWPECDVPPHDFVLSSHAMYGVKDFKSFVRKMNRTAKKGCILVMRAPLMESVMAKAARHVFGQPYDSPNFQIAYNILLGMDIFPDVIMEEEGNWPSWENDSFEAAFEELKNRLNLVGDTSHDAFLKGLLESHLVIEDKKVVWPPGNRSALVYWEVS